MPIRPSSIRRRIVRSERTTGRFYGGCRRVLGYPEAVATTRSIEVRTEIPGPRSREIMERKRRSVADALGVVLPVVVAEGRGATFTDVDGNTFLDFVGGVGCLAVGHSHPRVVAAAQEQLQR